MVVDIRDVITCFKFGDDRFSGLASAEGQILPFPIDFDGRPYNTLTLPCERVMTAVFSSERCSNDFTATSPHIFNICKKLTSLKFIVRTM